MKGIVNIYKEKDYTSHDVVNIVRKKLGKQFKVGHTGTLDPNATGVLPICIGKATKIADYIMGSTKEYIAEVILGVKTDTYDNTGNILEEKTVSASRDEIINAVNSFTGEISQTPPMYSAIKVNGKKLYELARKGIEVERKKRDVTIYKIEILEFFDDARFSIKVLCSKGTYIRSLCNDIGEALNTCACMGDLVRTKTGNFLIEDSVTLEKFSEIVENDELKNTIIPIEEVLNEYKRVVVREELNKILYNGNKVNCKYVIYGEENKEIEHGESVLVYDFENNLVGIFKREDYFLIPLTMLV